VVREFEPTVLRPPAETGDWVQILQADPGLAEAIPEATRADAAVYTFAHTFWLEPGQWHPPSSDADEAAGHLGLLILNGFLIRQVRVIDRPPAELLGPGDLVHPWEPDHTEPFVAGARWDVLEPARVAVLDRRFAAVIGRWPDLVAALFGRAIARSRSLLLNLAIGQLVGVDIRLLVLLWHIAERWGDHDENGAADGVVVPVHLTHQIVASLISAQRPTVTSALAALTERGLISRNDEGFIVLHGEPPTEFRHLRSAMS
jgi:CRP/FNR family transcriptional regulator, cyclic AMP receptor protein